MDQSEVNSDGRIDYSSSTITVTLYPGPDCDMDKLHDDADDFALNMVEENQVMVDVVREERGSFTPNSDRNA